MSLTLNNESKFFIGTFIVTLVLVVWGLFLFNKPSPHTSSTTPSPTVTKEELITDSTPTAGPKDAATYLVEFSDFQCPACKSFQPTVDELIKKYPDKLLFAYRFFPLTQIHPQGMASAQAAVAAKTQNKFWEMHDLLFQNQSSLSADIYLKLAKDLNLDLTKFQADFVAAKDFVDKELAFGNSINIVATPTFFLNGVQLTLFNQADLTKAVDDAISSVK